MGVIDLDLQGHLAVISTQETAFNVSLVYWPRLAKGYVLHVSNVLLFVEDKDLTTVKCRYNAVFGVQEIDRVIAVTAL